MTKRRFASLMGTVLAVLLMAGAVPAAAQDEQALSDRVERLQRELSDLERYVYAGTGGTAGGSTGSVAASQEVRMQQLQAEISRVTGTLEQVTFRIDQLNQQLERLSKDVDFRLTALEQGGLPAGGASMSDAGTSMTADAATMDADTHSEAPVPTSSGSSGTLGTIPEDDLNAQLSTQPGVDPTATGAGTPSTASSTTMAAATVPYDLPGATPEEQYEHAFGLLRQANYPDAEAALRTFLDRHPDDLLAGNAQYWLGETYYVRGNYQQAALTFAEGYQKYPNSGKAPDNLLKLGMALGQLGKTEDACVALGQLRKQFPNAPDNIQDRAARERQRYGCS
ncbi:MAG: tol-pal system protein YbgF [Rhodospirillaceae bacterium]|nr:tol-pal system protein YbgF [Rhodospirillaceae bacterium]